MNKFIELINESKRTGCLRPANCTFTILFHHAINDPNYLILLESNNINWKQDLLTVKEGKYGACIPVTKLKDEVLTFCYKSIGKKNRGTSDIKVVKRKVHNRNIKPTLPKQEQYLFSKLQLLNPNWREISERYLR